MTDLARKLLIRPGQRVAILNGPGGTGWLEPLPEGAVVDESSAGFAGRPDVIVLFVAGQADLDRLAPGLPVDPDPETVTWIAYPKLTSRLAGDLSRDRLWGLMEPRGLTGVTQVAIDETWSALRFRPAANVGRPTKG